MKNSLFFILSLFLLFSCSIQKRRYVKGYYLSRNTVSMHKDKEYTHFHAKVGTDPETVSTLFASPPKHQEQPVSASAQPDMKLSASKPVTYLHLKKDPPCDEIFFRDSTRVSAKVIEVTATEVRYKKCDKVNGPTFVEMKWKISMIRYANGEKDQFTDDVPQSPYLTRNPNGQVHTHVMAVLALVFGIVSLVSAGGIISGIVGGILGIVFANKALRAIGMEPNKWGGAKMARIGRGLAISGLLLSLLILFIIIAV